METKKFILVLMFLLLVPLFVVAFSSSSPGVIKTSPLLLKIETTSDWTEVIFKGATIKEGKVGEFKGDRLRRPIITANSIILDKDSPLDDSHGMAELSLTLDVYEDVVDMVIDKGDLGNTNASIEDIGEFLNDKGTIKVPLMVETTSNWTMVTFDGMSIIDAELKEFKGRKVKKPIISSDAILLERYTDTGDVARVGYLLDIMFTDEFFTLVIDKSDGGYTIVDMGDFGRFENLLAMEPLEKVIEIPLRVETTSNFTGIRFSGAEINKVDIVDTEGNPLVDKIVGENSVGFLFNSIGYEYGKLSITLGLENISDVMNMTIDNDGGYTIISIGNENYVNFATPITGNVKEEKILNARGITISPADYGADFNINSPIERSTRSIASSVSYLISASEISESGLETIAKLPVIRSSKKLDTVTVPFSIETTSDWTDVRFEGADILKFETVSKEGLINEPGISKNMISMANSGAEHSTLAKINLLLDFKSDPDSEEIKMTIEKGDLGYTRIYSSELGSFTNSRNIRSNPRNQGSFTIVLPSQTISREISERVLVNPEYFSIFLPESEVNVQTNIVEYALHQKDFSGVGKSFSIKPSTKVGLLGGVLLFYLMLSIIGFHIFRKEGYFVIGEEKKTDVRAWIIKTFEEMPAGSLYVLLALITLIMTAFILMVNHTAAEASAIAAYLFLVIGITLRIFGYTKASDRIFNYIDAKTLMFLVKSTAILAALSAAIVVGYEFLGKIGLLIMSIPSAVFLIEFYRYVTRQFDESEYTSEW